MSRTRPGIDRIMRQSAHATLIMARGAIATHLKTCAKCSKSGTNMQARCSYWWKLATKIHSLKKTLRQWDINRQDNQPTLPGM